MGALLTMMTASLAAHREPGEPAHRGSDAVVSGSAQEASARGRAA